MGRRRRDTPTTSPATGPTPPSHAPAQPTELFLIDAPTERELDRADIAPNQPAELGDERTPVERLEAAMRRRDDEDLALDRIDDIGTHPPSDRDPHTGQPQAPRASSAGGQSTSCGPNSRSYTSASATTPNTSPTSSTPHAARVAEAQRAADEAAARVAELERPAGGLLRRRTGDPTALAFERERLTLAEHHAATAAERERELAAQVPDRATWEAERRVLLERAAELETQLSIRRREHVHDALERPAPYLLASLGEPPDQPRARRTWRQAAERIEAYRFDHTITDNQRRPRRHDPPRHPLADTGSEPSTTSTEPSTSSASTSNAASGGPLRLSFRLEAAARSALGYAESDGCDRREAPPPSASRWIDADSRPIPWSQPRRDLCRYIGDIGHKPHLRNINHKLDIGSAAAGSFVPRATFPRSIPMAVATPSTPTILRRAEAAKRLGVHPNTLASWIKRGWLTGVTMPSGEVRFREEDVEALRERIYAE